MWNITCRVVLTVSCVGLFVGPESVSQPRAADQISETVIVAALRAGRMAIAGLLQLEWRELAQKTPEGRDTQQGCISPSKISSWLKRTERSSRAHRISTSPAPAAAGSPPAVVRSGHNILDDAAVDIGQAKVAAAVAIGQSLVV